MHGRSKGTFRRGFTLVELLVVIGIIALLVSILLPSLQSARRAAETVKCASALREIGQANQFYVNENQGWAPPSKTRSNYRISYTQWTPPVDSNIQQFWFQFLAKYVTRTKLGASTSNAAERQQARQSLLWGCPAWEGYYSNAFTGGINYGQTGYGFNAFPEYTASYPAAGVLLGDTFAGQGAGDTQAISTPSSTDGWTTIAAPPSGSATGKWYKWKPYSVNGSQRALVSDAQFWLLEVMAPVPLNGSPYPGQNSQYNINTWTQSGQMLYDVYRHGRKPKIDSTTNTYNLVGGKIAYNVLFCDGHVTTLTDFESGYRAGRMRYPG
jgi:prepilin-type N-terminal cleavage/methylation domain-containing protein/prepilin-type processing-associated H-X9-DG protein